MRYLIFGIVLTFCAPDALSQRLCLGAQQTISEYQRGKTGDSLLMISIVFHNLYVDDGQRVHEEQISSQLEVINADFQRLNPDATSTPDIFKSVAADCQIGFCLATVDPFGNASGGVNFISTNKREIGLSQSYHQTSLGGQTIWNPDQYLNVWICEIDEAGSIAGFARGASNTFRIDEGIVIDYRFFGTGGTALAPYNLGRTLTHEIGHYLGLNHIWGDSASCLSDDGLDDTPLQMGATKGCPLEETSSCGSPDMYMNFMDLTEDRCMNLFTQDQRQQMRSVLIRQKPNFHQGPNCEQTVSYHQKMSQELLLTPNPVTQTLVLPLFCDRIMVISNLGNLVREVTMSNEVGVDDLPAGLYFLRAVQVRTHYQGIFVKR